MPDWGPFDQLDPVLHQPIRLMVVTILAAVAEAQDCMVFSWFRYAMGHQEEQADTCTINGLRERFAASQQNLHDLLVGIVTSDGFRYRAEPAQ